jgi:hypothetical protein
MACTRRSALRYFILTTLVAALSFSCTHPGARYPGGRATPLAADTPPHLYLEADLTRLLGYRDPETQRLARAIQARTEELARTYRVQAPAIGHNILVNLGLRARGLCCHWAQDLMQTLAALQLQHFQVTWGVSRYRTRREHNSIVVTAAGQPFASGLVIDPWRKSGDLYWIPVALDTYPWEPHPAENGAARIGCR